MKPNQWRVMKPSLALDRIPSEKTSHKYNNRVVSWSPQSNWNREAQQHMKEDIRDIEKTGSTYKQLQETTKDRKAWPWIDWVSTLHWGINIEEKEQWLNFDVGFHLDGWSTICPWLVSPVSLVRRPRPMFEVQTRSSACARQRNGSQDNWTKKWELRIIEQRNGSQDN